MKSSQDLKIFDSKIKFSLFLSRSRGLLSKVAMLVRDLIFLKVLKLNPLNFLPSIWTWNKKVKRKVLVNVFDEWN